MPESTGGEILALGEFPPTSSAEWEETIRRDRKGSDFDRKLVWRTDEGIAVRPYYRAGDLAGLEAQLAAEPGQAPFVRGTGEPWTIAQEDVPPPGAIRADDFHERGAHAVQELAFALAAGVERLEQLRAGKPVDEAARQIEFVFAIGPCYFIEIAKFRAARLLWSQALTAFGAAPAPMRIAARTPLRNKSVHDRYTNLLRATTEALAAAVAGCDRITVQPFGFDGHLGANVQRILREEARIGSVADPAGGSYYIEMLTASLAREAWALFQQVERQGGFAGAVATGWIDRALAESRAALEKSIASRRRTLVGVNNFPNLLEKPAEIPQAPSGWRLATPFEEIRRRTLRHARQTGRPPEVLLWKRGDLKMREARAGFCRNFFGCAGFAVRESEECGPADLVVLCSSDAEYLDWARECCPKSQAPVIVAGNPKDQIEALRACGVGGFVHIACDAVQTLTYWQDRLGMKK